jgi:hypothetical protein
MEQELFKKLIILMERTEQQINKNLEFCKQNDEEGDFADTLMSNSNKLINEFESNYLLIKKSHGIQKDISEEIQRFIDEMKEVLKAMGTFESFFTVASISIKPVISVIKSYPPIRRLIR